MFTGTNLKADVEKLNQYIATNQALRESMQAEFPVPEDNMYDFISGLRKVEENAAKALNAHYLGVSREVYYVFDVEYVKATHNSEGYMRYTGFNGVDTSHEYVERKKFRGDGYMVEGVKWRHFLKNFDEYVLLIWKEDGLMRRKLVHIEFANATSPYWKIRDIRAEVIIAKKCIELVKKSYILNDPSPSIFHCPHCSHNLRLCLNSNSMLVNLCRNSNSMLVNLCRGCGKAFIVTPRAEALGIVVEEDRPEKTTKNTRWEQLEIGNL